MANLFTLKCISFSNITQVLGCDFSGSTKMSRVFHKNITIGRINKVSMCLRAL